MKVFRFYKIGSEILKNSLSRTALYYIVEGANWSIKHDGINITKNLNDINAKITTVPYGLGNKIVHFGSVNTFWSWLPMMKFIRPTGHLIVTWFHVSPGDERIRFIPESDCFVRLWHTSCDITKMRLSELGVPEEKIRVIPLGVDTNIFCEPINGEKQSIRKSLGIPEQCVVIGSFQKDGNGWREGLDPKMIKGPDIFCDVVERLAKHFNIFVLLTGPARGYVKSRLSGAGIPFFHQMFSDPNKVSEYYKAINLYMITSRAEGGPKALLEAAASGVPLVSTRVGISPEFIVDGENGFLCDVEDIEGLIQKSSFLLADKQLSNDFSKSGKKKVADYDWEYIAKRYYDELYKNLLN